MGISPSRLYAPPSLRSLIRLTLLLLVVTGVYLGYLQLSTNVHAVVDGQVYRSAQPSPAKLGELVKEYGIKSVLNLRGDSSGEAWYDNEVAAAKGLNVQHIDFRMSATKELMAAAPKPMLIHCKAGADRTGLASAIYVAGVAKEGEMAAESQISLTYGHLSLFFIGAYAMDRTFERLEPMFGFFNS